MLMDPQHGPAQPQSDAAPPPTFLRRVGRFFKSWLRLYPGCGCKADVCDPGDPMSRLPNTSPVDPRKK